MRDIRFRLVVVIVADEIFHGILREKGLQFAVELSRKRFVVRDHDCRFAKALDHIRHGESFAGTGDTLKNLKAPAICETATQSVYRIGLIARRLEWRAKFELRLHG